MKTNKKIDKFLLHCRSVLALVLCVVMLGNMTLEARGISSVSTQHIRTQVAERVNQFSTPKTPEQFLNDTREELEKLLTEEAPSEDALSKLTLQQYSIAYTKELDKFYQQQTDLLAQKVKTALAEFDKEAAAAWQTAQQNFENTQGTMTSQELMMAQEELKRYEKYLEDEKKQYAILVEQERAGWEKQLNEEHAAYIKNIPQEYATYSNEYDAALKDLEKTQIEFYKELIAQIILNYQQTRDIESKENFITLMLYLSSFTQKDQFFTKGDKQFALQELAKNFQTQGVCGGHVSVEYDSRGTWGTSFIGGSPSAGKIVDVQMNKKYVYKLSDEQGCNLALSSLIPFANLNGSGHDITKFLKDNFDNPMFGQMLLIGAKALTLTRNHNMEAFDKFMDEAIETEIASSKRSFWGKAWDMASFEEMSGAIFSGLDGKYMSHNVSSSAKRGIGEPNVWEDVAQLLVEYNTPQADAILKKAIDRCALRRKGVPPQEEQHLECRGIYPFLLGVITQKPELVENLVVEPLRINDNPGPEFTSTGRTRIVTEEEAKERHQYKLQHDISLKFTKGEMLGHFFYDQFFEDIYPDDKLRMDTLLANVATLNPKNTMTAYLKNDERYHKLEKRFNKNLVVRGIGSIGDTIVTIWCIKDLFLLLFRIGPALKNLSNFMKIRKVIIEYRLFPNTMSKSLKMAHALQARGITTAQLQKHHAFLTKVTNFKKGIRQVPNIRTKIIAHFTEGRVSPLSQGSVGSLRQHGVAHHLRQGGKGVRLSKVSAGAPSPTLRPMQQVKAAVKGSLFADAWRWATPKIAADTKEATFFNVNDAHFTYTDKAGKPLEITEIKIQDGVLYINGEMAKTYKAYLSLEQLEALAAMASEEKVTLGFNGMWVKLVSNNGKASEWEKLVSLSRQITTVPLYNAEGVKIMEVGLNTGFKLEKSLLTRINNGAKLIFKDGKIHILENGVLEMLSQFDRISIPKTAINNMVKGKNIGFLTKLFSGPAAGQAPWSLNLQRTSSKLFWPMAVNTLSYSAASSSLMMTLEKEPFNLSSSTSILVGLALPYLSGFLAPYLMPFVKRLGARNVMVGSLLLATGALGVATFSGYNGTASYEKDYNGDVMRDESGRAIIRKDRPVVWPLITTAVLTGVASTGIRATSNVVLKAYELNQSTMNLSMLFKSVGGAAFTFVPWVYALADKNRDFSVTYPWLAGLSLLTAGGLLTTMPKMSTFGYKTINKADFRKPWGLFKKRTVWPYVSGIALMSSLEGYVYFKGLNGFARDVFGQKEGDGGILAENGPRLIKKNPANAKFFSSLVTAIPQIILRRWSPRRAYFGRGLFNSALLSGAGTVLLMQPTENSSVGANIALGAISGLAIGFGTAQVFQYNQKLMTAAVKATYGEKMVPTAIVLHSMGNVGFVLPSFFGMEAQQRKELYGENDFFSTQRTFNLPLSTYALGLSLIFGAEHHLFPRARLLAPFGRFIGSSIPWVIGGSNLLSGRLFTTPTVAVPTLDGASGTDEVAVPSLPAKDFHLSVPSSLNLRTRYLSGGATSKIQAGSGK